MGEAQIKDLALGARLAADITDNKTWREEQPAQLTVSRANVVDEIVRRVRG
jgi:histidyl-tRNA synthetase